MTWHAGLRDELEEMFGLLVVPDRSDFKDGFMSIDTDPNARRDPALHARRERVRHARHREKDNQRAREYYASEGGQKIRDYYKRPEVRERKNRLYRERWAKKKAAA